MIAKETLQESHEYDPQPQRIFKTFAADIYESSNLEPQTVFVYPIHLDGEVVDCEIKMPILLKPSSIREDVEAALYSEYQLMLGNLKFTLMPQNYSI